MTNHQSQLAELSRPSVSNFGQLLCMAGATLSFENSTLGAIAHTYRDKFDRKMVAYILPRPFEKQYDSLFLLLNNIGFKPRIGNLPAAYESKEKAIILEEKEVMDPSLYSEFLRITNLRRETLLERVSMLQK